ncbi:MS Related Protein [Caenorhabditis elegans]|uniref:MS Related Protein n=1 Tax=Caenorhabditis elegans TaxID=6239 RepID=Q9N3X4_CAEEL|nr:MS Related Protein [Caenorhabditis elegans]CCD74047.1 MS Related Protein [Caenorhabditis elegans]|eukprot:NP_501101.2 Uncharacterized protein CELE_Y43B11AR.1 [Caenorhabditis elegans]
MKFGTSFLLVATISMIFAVVKAEDAAPAVVEASPAPVEPAVTGAVAGGDGNKEAGEEITGKSAGGSAVDVSTVVPVHSSDIPASSPTIETTTKSSTTFSAQLLAVAVLVLHAVRY